MRIGVFGAAVAAALFELVILATPAIAENIYVDGNSARFRAGPGTDYTILWEAPRYTPLEYLAKYRDWYVIRDHAGDVGWVHQQVIKEGVAAIVTNRKANIRKGPGTKNPIVFWVEEGYRFKVLEKKGNWYHVMDLDGSKGWVLDKLVWTSR